MNIKQAIEKFDKSNYLRFLVEFPEQLKDSLTLEIPGTVKQNINIRNVVIAGMGGSAIGGELVQSIYYDEIPVPMQVVRDYNLPSFVNRNSLVIVSSYSGNTEETLSAYRQVLQTGASVICITTGGILAQKAEGDSIPVVFLPKGYQPRAAVGYSAIPLMRILQGYGLLSEKISEIEETINCIRNLNKKYSPENGEQSEPFKLAVQIKGEIPVIYTGPPPFSALGIRWRCQLNENAQILAFSNIFPELNHNEIMGWDKEVSNVADIFAVFLRDKDESPSIARRIEITQEIIRKHSGEFAEVWCTGKSVLAKVFSLLYYGDYTSYYLALLNKKDPSVIENINYLKTKLQKL